MRYLTSGLSFEPLVSLRKFTIILPHMATGSSPAQTTPVRQAYCFRLFSSGCLPLVPVCPSTWSTRLEMIEIISMQANKQLKPRFQYPKY